MISRPMQHGCDVHTITTYHVIRIKRSVNAIYDMTHVIVHKDIRCAHDSSLLAAKSCKNAQSCPNVSGGIDLRSNVAKKSQISTTFPDCRPLIVHVLLCKQLTTSNGCSRWLVMTWSVDFYLSLLQLVNLDCAWLTTFGPKLHTIVSIFGLRQFHLTAMGEAQLSHTAIWPEYFINHEPRAY